MTVARQGKYESIRILIRIYAYLWDATLLRVGEVLD